MNNDETREQRISRLSEESRWMAHWQKKNNLEKGQAILALQAGKILLSEDEIYSLCLEAGEEARNNFIEQVRAEDRERSRRRSE